jgi:subtilisin family serine protease
MKKNYLLLLFIISVFARLDSQTLVNEVWSVSSGEPVDINISLSQWDKIDWTSSALTNNNELIIVGNTLQSAGNTDVLVTKYDTEGQIIWEQTFGGDFGNYDYGLATSIDANGNILVAGIVTTLNQTTDIVILKYTENGTLLWSRYLGSNNNQFDIPTSLVTDMNGSIYVTGGTYNLLTKTDWLVSKLDANGMVQWNKSYNYADLDEAAIEVGITNNGNVAVRGFSSPQTSIWDFAEVVFSSENGDLLQESRKEIPDISVTDALGLANDGNGNIYILGSTTGQTNEGKNIQLIKINSSFDIEWVKTIDKEGLEDRGKDIVIDYLGNIIIGGNSEKTNGGIQMTIVKFSPVGTQIFKKDYLAPITSGKAEISKLKVSEQGDLLVTGSVDKEGSKNFVTIIYDSEGRQKAEKFYSGNSDSDKSSKSLDITSNGDILISGKSEGNDPIYTTVKYETLKRSENIILEDGEPNHRADEFIVKFLPQYVNNNFVDDRRRRYGSIDDVLTTEAASFIKERMDMRSANLSKVFPRMTTSHTHSITRLGETIAIPEFWSVFLVVLEPGQDLDEMMSQLDGMSEYVVYAHHNHLYQKQTLPDDEFFVSNDQSSLFPSDDFPNADINVEPAWDIETGRDNTRVGIYDDVIFWAHEDFGDGTLEGSQIAGGWDYNNDSNIASVTNPESHGTAVAGIIGALRDNGTGVAGIAGGGLDAQGNDNEGVQLFSLGIFDVTSAGADVIGPAIMEGAMFSPTQSPTGFGLHIQNHSWGAGEQNATIRSTVRFAWKNQCVLVTSRGNTGTSNLRYPSCYNDNWVISVGGSGNNGEYYNGNNGNSYLDGSGLTSSGSSFGGGMDIIAPATTENVMSPINPNSPFSTEVDGVELWPVTEGDNNNYQPFNGTSSAAPHVSGVAALMYSRHNVNQGQPNNLAPEDIEFILQRYATDIINSDPNFNYPVGYDDNNGWGRLNAFGAVSRVNAPQWQVFHSGEPSNVSQTTAVGMQITLPLGYGNLPAGVYYANRVQTTSTYLDVFSPSTQIIDSWGRLSSTTGISAANPVSGDSWADFDFVIQDNVASVTTTTFAWLVTQSVVNNQSIDVWIPAPPEDLQTAYSLHLFDSQATSTEEVEELGLVSAYPSPTDGVFTIKYELVDAIAVSVQICDITGKVISENDTKPDKSGSILMDLSNVSGGMYIWRLVTDKGIISRKIVKQ